jgi:chromate transporter
LTVGTLLDWQSIVIAIIGALLIWRWRVDPIWPILGGATIGLVRQLAQSYH